MKRKIIAWSAAVLIVALISACFFRPVPAVPEDTIAFTKNEKLSISGTGADRFEVTFMGVDCEYDFPTTYVTLFICSTDGKYYTLGEEFWVKGDREIREYTQGYVMRLGEEGWYDYDRMYSGYSELMVLDHCVRGTIIRPLGEEEPGRWGNAWISMPFWEPGHYRVNLVAREYHPAEGEEDIAHLGSNSDSVYIISFEYDVPELNGEPMDVLSTKMWDATRENDTIAGLNAILHANAAARYIQPDTLRIKRLDDSGELVTDGTQIIASYGGNLETEIVRQYEHWLRGWEWETERGYYDDKPYDMDIYLATVPLSLGFKGWEPGGEYVFSVSFTENPDGSGERYELVLRLKFDMPEFVE